MFGGLVLWVDPELERLVVRVPRLWAKGLASTPVNNHFAGQICRSDFNGASSTQQPPRIPWVRARPHKPAYGYTIIRYFGLVFGGIELEVPPKFTVVNAY